MTQHTYFHNCLCVELLCLKLDSVCHLSPFYVPPKWLYFWLSFSHLNDKFELKKR